MEGKREWKKEREKENKSKNEEKVDRSFDCESSKFRESEAIAAIDACQMDR